MKKSRLQSIINELKAADLTDEERAELFASIDIKEIEVEKDIAVEAVESFIELVSADENMFNKYGLYINKYYSLPISGRKRVCDYVYKHFLEYGSFNIDIICAILNPGVACDEKDVDPVVSAMKESAELLENQPNIDFSKVRIPTDPVITAIQENNKLYEKRPVIDFTGIKYDI